MLPSMLLCGMLEERNDENNRPCNWHVTSIKHGSRNSQRSKMCSWLLAYFFWSLSQLNSATMQLLLDTSVQIDLGGVSVFDSKAHGSTMKSHCALWNARGAKWWEQQTMQLTCNNHQTWLPERCYHHLTCLPSLAIQFVVGLAHNRSWSFIGSKFSADSPRCSSEYCYNW